MQEREMQWKELEEEKEDIEKKKKKNGAICHIFFIGISKIFQQNELPCYHLDKTVTCI